MFQIEYYNKTLEEFLEEDSAEKSDVSYSEPDKTIWTVGAINLLIRFRGELKDAFDNKTRPKKRLWEEIASKITAAGFDVGENAAEKCRMKFTSLQLKYKDHFTLITATATKPTMPFYEELQNILGPEQEPQPTMQVHFTIPDNEGSYVHCHYYHFASTS